MVDKKELRIEKEALIAEYLMGEISLRGLSKKYGVPHSTINKWVLIHQGRWNKPSVKKNKKKPKPILSQAEELPKEIKQLQAELRRSKLHNALLNEMIDIAEKDLGISIRKKSGTKRS